MGPSDSTSGVIREDVRCIFSPSNEPSIPLTAAEIAEELEYDTRAVRDELAELADRGELWTRRIDDQHQVWWRSNDESTSVDQRSELDLTKPADSTEFIETVRSFQSSWLSVVRLPSREDA